MNVLLSIQNNDTKDDQISMEHSCEHLEIFISSEAKISQFSLLSLEKRTLSPLKSLQIWKFLTPLEFPKWSNACL